MCTGVPAKQGKAQDTTGIAKKGGRKPDVYLSFEVLLAATYYGCFLRLVLSFLVVFSTQYAVRSQFWGFGAHCVRLYMFFGDRGSRRNIQYGRYYCFSMLPPA